jgi:hypothetical protein
VPPSFAIAACRACIALTVVGLRKLDHRSNQRSLISGLCDLVPAAATVGASTIAVVTAASKKVCVSL